MSNLGWRSETYDILEGGARVRAEGPSAMPQLTWPEFNYALEPKTNFPGPSTCREAALNRKFLDQKILLGCARETPEAQSLEFFFLVHGYNVHLAASNYALLNAARNGTVQFEAIIVDETITDQTLSDLCRIPWTTFVPIIEFTRTKPRAKFVSAVIPKACKTDGVVRKLDAIISIARDVRQNGYLRAAFSELEELDRLFGPTNSA